MTIPFANFLGYESHLDEVVRLQIPSNFCPNRSTSTSCPRLLLHPCALVRDQLMCKGLSQHAVGSSGTYLKCRGLPSKSFGPKHKVTSPVWEARMMDPTCTCLSYSCGIIHNADVIHPFSTEKYLIRDLRSIPDLSMYLPCITFSTFRLTPVRTPGSLSGG